LNLERPQSAAALLAAGGLLILAIAMVVRASALVEPVTMITASATVLASAFLGRQRSGAGGDRIDPSESAAGGAHAGTPDAQPATPARAVQPNPPAAPDPVDASRQDEPWFEALLEFAKDTLGALQGDRLRQLIAQKLPALVGRDDVWVVANPGAHQQVILPQRLDHEQRRMLSDEPRQWATFPLKADGLTVGVLGIELGNRGITAREWRMLNALAGVLGRALKTSEAFEAMREATLVDPLTGCATRAEGMRRFEAELRRAERSKTSLAVLMIDLDHFKSINDRFGHNTGDAVLSVVGETLLGTLRASDIRSRWGGEEFLVVLPESTIERASSAAESLRQRIAAAAVRDGNNTVRVTTSIGITIGRPGETDIPRLLGRADTALYQAKSEGRNRVMISLGDQKGSQPVTPPAANEPPSGTVPAHARDRRGQTHTDRRSGMGRRRTDLIAGPWAAGNS
jgi:diguanylate cyclase (GGDEF)-like protein